MKKLFFLGFAILFLLLSFTAPALANSSIPFIEGGDDVSYDNSEINSEEIVTTLADEDFSAVPPEDIEQVSLEDLTDDEILALSCETFIVARNVSDITAEDLYKKQSIFIGNLEFAKHSQFRLDPKDNSLEEINTSFLQSDFVQERQSSLAEMKSEYLGLVGECLKKQKETSFTEEINNLQEEKTARVKEIQKNLKNNLKRIDKGLAIKEEDIEKETSAKLEEAEKSAKAEKQSLRKTINSSYNQLYSGEEASIYNETIVSSENALESLPKELEKKKTSIENSKKKALKKSAKQNNKTKKQLRKKEKGKIAKLEKELNEQITLKEKEKEEALAQVDSESQEIADRIYSKREATITAEGAALEERKQYGQKLITYLKYTWQEDRGKKLKRLLTESINLDSESITVKAVIDPPESSNKREQKLQKARRGGAKKAKSTSQKIKKDRSGKVAGKRLNNKSGGKNGGSFVGNIDRIWKEHNSANGDWSGPTLPSYVVAALAQAAGMPGVTMEQVTRGESGAHKKNSARPGATGVDPGGTKGYGLWMITTSFNDDLAKKVGGYKKFLNPVLNAWAAAQIYKRNGLGAWYGTRSVKGDGIHYKGNYDLRNALGGKTYKQVLASYGIGVGKKKKG